MNSDEMVNLIEASCNAKLTESLCESVSSMAMQTFLLAQILRRLESIDDLLACIMQNTEKND